MLIHALEGTVLNDLKITAHARGALLLSQTNFNFPIWDTTLWVGVRGSSTRLKPRSPLGREMRHIDIFVQPNHGLSYETKDVLGSSISTPLVLSVKFRQRFMRKSKGV